MDANRQTENNVQINEQAVQNSHPNNNNHNKNYNEAHDSYNATDGDKQNYGDMYPQQHSQSEQDYNGPNSNVQLNLDENGESISTIYVSRLAFRTTQQDLTNHFSAYGKVTNCYLVVDPHTKESRGFAFITFETPDEAINAINGSKNLKLDGASVVVEKSRRTNPRSPTPGRYSGNRLRIRHHGFGIRRDYYRPYGRDFDRHRPPYHREYHGRDSYVPRERFPPEGGRYSEREPFNDPRSRDRPLERPLPPRRDYYSRGERDPYPPRDPRDSYMSSYPRERDPRGVRGPPPPRERYHEVPRERDTRIQPHFERERDGAFDDRYRHDRNGPPPMGPRDNRPRYHY